MPVSIRSLAPTISLASYLFTTDSDKAAEEDWPWLHVQSSANNLCENCSRLNFPWLFTNALSAYTVTDGATTAKLSDGICLGLYADILSRSSCTFCQLLVYALEQTADIEMMYRYNEWPRKELWINNHFLGKGGFVMDPGADADKRIAQLGVHFKAENEDRTSVKLGGCAVMIQQIFEAPNALTEDLGRALDTDVIDLVQTIRDWVQPCLARGIPVLSTKREDFASIRLIDTRNNCIVGPLYSQRYVVLSYTWGKIDPLVLLAENEPELYKKDALSAHRDKLPVTIRDAISLCSSLGERYLWVDSLCIMQDTPDKHSQIQQMDRIYQEAAFCIVAAAGKDANAGLPGVSKPRDAQQCVINVNGMLLANKVPPLGQSLSQTFWKSRGWCYQECLLSSCKLVFTFDQTYFQCPHGECPEDTHSSIHNSRDLTTDRLPWLLSLDSQFNWQIYTDVQGNYSSLDLSFEGDVLNAFAGVSNLVSKLVFSGCPFVMGIPLCSLEVGLMWYPFNRLQRRSVGDIPSWSWTGWIGPTEYLPNGNSGKDFDRTINQVEWHLGTQKKLVTGIPPQSWDGWKDWKRVVRGISDEVHYVHAESGPDRWFSHPITQQQWPVQPHSPFLRCTVEIADMILTGEHTKGSIRDERCEEGHEMCLLKVLDQHGKQAGLVIMNGATFDKTSFYDQSFTFVKIPRMTYTSSGDPAWDPVTKTYTGRPGEPGTNPQQPQPVFEDEFDHDVYDSNICWCMYNVLVVKMEADVAYRIAAGRVYYTAFDNASPKRKTIRLG